MEGKYWKQKKETNDNQQHAPGTRRDFIAVVATILWRFLEASFGGGADLRHAGSGKPPQWHATGPCHPAHSKMSGYLGTQQTTGLPQHSANYWVTPALSKLLGYPSTQQTTGLPQHSANYWVTPAHSKLLGYPSTQQTTGLPQHSANYWVTPAHSKLARLPTFTWTPARGQVFASCYLNVQSTLRLCKRWNEITKITNESLIHFSWCHLMFEVDRKTEADCTATTQN